MRRKDSDPPHIVRVLDLRERLIEMRAEMMHPKSEALDTAAGAATCIICYLADHIETLRRWHAEQTDDPVTRVTLNTLAKMKNPAPNGD